MTQRPCPPVLPRPQACLIIELGLWMRKCRGQVTLEEKPHTVPDPLPAHAPCWVCIGTNLPDSLSLSLRQPPMDVPSASPGNLEARKGFSQAQGRRGGHTDGLTHRMGQGMVTEMLRSLLPFSLTPRGPSSTLALPALSLWGETSLLSYSLRPQIPFPVLLGPSYLCRRKC